MGTGQRDRSHVIGHALRLRFSSPLEAGGSSPMTVFRPMLEMSLSCSLSDSMLVHSVSTIVSTWYSFTLLTRGPRLPDRKKTHTHS